MRLYADDTQIYKQFNPGDLQSLWSAINGLEDCIREVGDWMAANKLMLNEQKTELMLLVSRYCYQLVDMFHLVLRVGDAWVSLAKSVRDL